MKTEISRFCEACLHDVNALRPPLRTAAEKMEQGSDKALLQKPLAALNDIRARLRSLAEKLANQHAYLLIFGPLKSGKSTLMNAISGAYVSEVTSLPGYPCLVFVQHAAKPHFSVTRYNGRESVFADSTALNNVVAESHVSLAAQIRVTEERGDSFHPEVHFTEAIRRVDVKLPVQSLAESSTVLVDTPGLYSRMNFGYDVLTREFRNSAACAVFVVKTDNLFLEQVFEEFNQLLDLFSRIFLVINVDSSKRDLAADGSLHPSAESEDPARIVDAFRTLSMAGRLRQAYEKGRLRLHAVDLLSAASAFLSGNGQASGHEREKEAFAAFLRDLTEYLNSSDYTVEFIRDSLRQGRTLCDEVRGICDGSELGKLREEQERLAREMREIDDQIAAVDRLLKVDWSGVFEKARAENTARGKQRAMARAQELAAKMREALDRWFEGPASLKSLEEKSWNPLLVEAGRALAEDTRFRLQSYLGTPTGGAEPDAATVTDLNAAEVRLAPIAQPALAQLSEADAIEPYQMGIAQDAVPVRKSFLDWIAFRGIATVRRRLFGEDSTQEIAPELKLKRLPERSSTALVRMIDTTVEAKFPALPAQYSEGRMRAYVEKFCAEVLQALRRRREELVTQRADRQLPFVANAELFTAMQQLNEQAAKVATAVSALAERENAALAGTASGAPS